MFLTPLKEDTVFQAAEIIAVILLTVQIGPQCASISSESRIPAFKASANQNSFSSALVVRPLIIVHGQTTHQHFIDTVEDIKWFQESMTTFSENIQIIAKVGTAITLLLKRTPGTITKKFVRKYFTSSGKLVIEKAGDKERLLASCTFTGHVLGDDHSLVSLSLCNGVEGAVQVAADQFYISASIVGANVVHTWVREASGVERTCDMADNRTIRPLNRSRRDIKLPSAHTTDTRYLELYAIADNGLYQSLNNSIDKVVERVVNIVNIAGGLFRDIGIYLALVGVEVWTNENQITYRFRGMVEDGYSVGDMIVDLNRYRISRVVRDMPNDNTVLFTAADLVGKVIGRSSKIGALCSLTQGSAIVYHKAKTGYGYITAGIVLAHELGHNLGMLHANDKRAFPEGNCECQYEDSDYTACILDFGISG